ncbi:hypothetical protein A2U01_0075883, partial [Trifolium medium]|nr:hypothetical protein [Trifolium medium]
GGATLYPGGASEPPGPGLGAVSTHDCRQSVRS